LLLVAADRDVRALPGQLDQVLLGDRLGLLHARALLPALWGALVVLGDVNELAAPAWPAGDDRQLAHLAHRPGAEPATRGRPGRAARPAPRQRAAPRAPWEQASASPRPPGAASGRAGAGGLPRLAQAAARRRRQAAAPAGARAARFAAAPASGPRRAGAGE